MTLFDDLLKRGALLEALEAIQAQVRKSPSEPGLRVFLFQLHCILGNWDKALTQLSVLNDLSAGMAGLYQTYKTAIKCEQLRASIFKGKHTPLFLGEPEGWMVLLLQAMQLTSQDKNSEADTVRARALEAAPTIPGTINDQPFQWLSDADSRMGPILEAIINGKYYWISCANIESMTIEKPTDLRDLVWLPSVISLRNGGQTVALLPVRYPGSECSPDNMVKLSRKTEWAETSEVTICGQGQKMFSTDQDNYPILDVRTIKFGP